MENVIAETTRPNGVRVAIEDYADQSGRITFKVKDYYSDGSQRDCKFFGDFNSARICFNQIVEKENAIRSPFFED